jgi:hypothetical protein
MKKSALLAALLLCLPALASAQTEPAAAHPLLTVTAYTGVRAPFGGGTVSVYVPSGAFLAKQERTGSPLLGVDARIRLRGPLSLVGGGVYSQEGQVQYFLSDTAFRQQPDWIAESTKAMWFAKLGISRRFERARSITDTRRLPATDLVAAAAVVREFDDFHPALNLGFQGSLPMASGVELAIGLDDYLVFWNEDRLTPNVAGIVQRFQDEPIDQVVLHYSTSNIFQLRAGVSLRAW